MSGVELSHYLRVDLLKEPILQLLHLLINLMCHIEAFQQLGIDVCVHVILHCVPLVSRKTILSILSGTLNQQYPERSPGGGGGVGKGTDSLIEL